MNLILLAAMASNPALAWKHTYRVWDRNEFPVPWYLSDHVTKQLPADYQEQVLETSIQNWEWQAPCAQLTDQYMGVRSSVWDLGSQNEGMNTMYYDDPAAQNDEVAIGVTYTNTAGDLAFSLRDHEDATVVNPYFYTTDSDIVFSGNYQFYTTDEVDQGICQGGGYGIEDIATHEFGHFWGMGHSCEQADVDAGNCDGASLLEATMFWAGSACSNEPISLNADDVEGITALYGPYATFTVDDDASRYGGVPLDVCFTLESKGIDENGVDVVWNFGDGETSTEANPCHTYTTAGQYTVFITVSGTSGECGDFQYKWRKPAYVLSCEVPKAAEGLDGLFTFEWVEGTTYQMVNQADLSVYGCIDQVEWDVFKGGEKVQTINAWSPKIDFGGDGDYDVVLNLGGPGGVTAETLTITSGADGGGCSSVPASGAGLAGLLLGLGAVIRRRRRS